MKKNQGAAVALVFCFVAMIAIVGMITFNRYQERTETELAKAEEEAKAKEENKVNEDKPEIQEEQTESANNENVQAEIPTVDAPVSETPIVNSTTTKQALTFSETDTLIWPVDGNVILNYSMDQTIYFATLDQYKYNPALIISGEAGEPVLAAADGEVTAIKTNAQTGNTLLMDIGSGYTAIYGQLEEIRVQEGERIEQGAVIGYVSTPTKYYSVEGPNLYFQILKDDESVNPLDYLAE